MVSLPPRETLIIEFKSDRMRLPDNDLVEAVVGMTNAEGGTIYLGVENRGEPTGIHSDHQQLDGIVGLVANRTSPSVVVRISSESVADKHIALIHVPKSQQIVSTSSGKVLRRRIGADGNPECVPFFPHEYGSRLASLGTWDATSRPVPGATFDDFDSVERTRLRQFVGRNKGDAALLPLEDEEFDKALGLRVREGNSYAPTLLGLLLIGTEEALRRLVPTHEVAFQVLDGEDVKVNIFKRSPLLGIVEWLDTAFSSHNAEEEMQAGLFRFRVPGVDASAFREAVANALTHRDYTLMGAIHVRVESAAVIISNPGGFVEGVTLNNLLTTEPRPRNPGLADALKRIGLVERTGRGVDLIYRGLLRYGRPKPDYSGSNSRSVVLRMPTSAADMTFLKMILDEESRTQSPMPVDSLIALSVLRDNRRVSKAELAAAIQKDESAAARTLESLNEKGFVQAHGQTKGRTYTLAPSMYAALDEKSEYVRQSGFDRIQQKAMVQQYLEAHGRMKRQDVMELCRLNGPQASRLLVDMVREGSLEKEGERRWTVYRLRENGWMRPVTIIDDIGGEPD